jgi:hypothetical protein
MGLLAKASVATDGSKFKVVKQPQSELHARKGGAASGPARGERRRYL